MSVLCLLFGKTRQGWYDALNRAESEQVWDVILCDEIVRIRKKQPNSGLRKLYHQLLPFCEKWGIKMGRDKLSVFLGENGFNTRKKKYRVITTNSRHRFHKYKNLIEGIILMKANQLWVTDITYVKLKEEFAYLSLITDAYSRKIIGWALWPDLSTKGCMAALNQALGTLTKHFKGTLIHHSDRGIQYCSDAYTERLLNFFGQDSALKIDISMTQNGDPYENALAERMNRTIKEEMLCNRIFDNIDQARQAIAAAITEYNEVRPHQSLDFLTPTIAHKMTGDIPKRWKKYPFKPKNDDPIIVPLPAPQVRAVI